MIHEELSGKIIGAAMTVLNELGPGLDDGAGGLVIARPVLLASRTGRGDPAGLLRRPAPAGLLAMTV